jgi:hypothetical protein
MHKESQREGGPPAGGFASPTAGLVGPPHGKTAELKSARAPRA